MLDGEIVIVDAQVRSSFQKLQRAMGKAITTGFAYEVFDLIYLDGFTLIQTPLKHRKELLKNLVGSNSHGVIRYCEHINGSGDEFFKHACEYGIEGIVSKLANSHYESTHNRNWLKVKCMGEQLCLERLLPAMSGSFMRVRQHTWATPLRGFISHVRNCRAQHGWLPCPLKVIVLSAESIGHDCGPARSVEPRLLLSPEVPVPPASRLQRIPSWLR
jgi:hypothetical protein